MQTALQIVKPQPEPGEAKTISRVMTFPVDRQCSGSLQSLKILLAKDARPWPVRAWRFVKVAIASLLFVLAAGCQVRARIESKPAEAAATPTTFEQIVDAIKPCPDEANDAALSLLNPMLYRWINDASSIGELQNAEHRIACLRPWADSMKDSCQREAIDYWLKSYQYQVEKKRIALLSNHVESDSERFAAEQRAKDERERQYTAKHPFPKLPRCDVEAKHR